MTAMDHGGAAEMPHVAGFTPHRGRIRRGETIPDGACRTRRRYGSAIHFLIRLDFGPPAAFMMRPAVAAVRACAVAGAAIARGRFRPLRGRDLAILAVDAAPLARCPPIAHGPWSAAWRKPTAVVVPPRGLRRPAPCPPLSLSTAADPGSEQAPAWFVSTSGHAAPFAAGPEPGLEPVFPPYSLTSSIPHVFTRLLGARPRPARPSGAA